MSVLIVVNSPSSGVGRITDWLQADGVQAQTINGEDLPTDLNGVDGLILLGGGFMPDNDEHAPWLPRERALTAQAIETGVPLLGICLGEQVLALTAGGEVTESSGETERGSCGVDLLPAAADDPLFAGLGGEQLRMIQNHKDSVTALPPGAVHLATSDACRYEAFRVGSAAWGIQFHPEVAASRLRTWDEASLKNQGIDRDALVQAAEADAPVNERQSRALIAAFAAVVRRRIDESSDGDGSLTAVPGRKPVITYRLTDGDGRVLAQKDPDTSFVPASTLKLAVLVATARALEAGDLTLDQKLPAEHTWPSKADGQPFGFDPDEVDPGMPAEGTPMSVREVLDRMITVSSNEATNMLMNQVGLDAIASALADAGATGSALGRLYGDMAAARKFGRASFVTSGDLAALMAALISGRLVGQEWTRFCTDLLARQRDGVIGGVVPLGTPWGSKSGWVNEIRHDVAFIGSTGAHARVLAVCTSGFATHPEAVAAIRGVAHALLHTDGFLQE